MEIGKKVIYVGRTDKYFTELKEYEVLGKYTDGCVLVIADRGVKWTIPQHLCILPEDFEEYKRVTGLF